MTRSCNHVEYDDLSHCKYDDDDVQLYAMSASVMNRPICDPQTRPHTVLMVFPPLPFFGLQDYGNINVGHVSWGGVAQWSNTGLLISVWGSSLLDAISKLVLFCLSFLACVFRLRH